MKQAAKSPLVLGGKGSLGSAPLERLSDNVSQWVALGCPTATESENSDAESAWAADVYRSIENALTPAEQKKRAYCERKLQVLTWTAFDAALMSLAI